MFYFVNSYVLNMKASPYHIDMKYILLTLLFFPFLVIAETITCYGTTSKGRLENGVQLPDKGNNYVAYSAMASLAGRTYVHSSVRDIMVSAY